MIPAITEVNFPQYATLHQATVSLQEMGDRTITTQVRIDGDQVPDFSGWELTFKGERFILPIKEPQAAKDNTTRNSLVDLTFYSWVTYQLKRYFFVSLSEIETGVAIPDQYIASVILPVESFVQLFNKVLQYYFGTSIRMELFGAGTGIYSTDPVSVEINYTYIWDVLVKFHEIFGLRWVIEKESGENGAYVIKVGYPADAIDDHDFEYGYKGGLLKFERQVQDDNIYNIILGRGGEKNLPYRYFKLQDPQNPEWAADPDAIPELANLYFDRLRDINFRWYVRGWMQNPNRDTSWDSTHTFPSYTENDCPAEYLFAFRLGKTDAKFNPVEYVKDDESITKYGERWGKLDDNDEIYPTIQGVTRTGLGRVDESVDISDIVTDDVDQAAQNAATTVSVEGSLRTETFVANQTKTITIRGKEFTVPSGMQANFDKVGEWVCHIGTATTIAGQSINTGDIDALQALASVVTTDSSVKVYNSSGVQVSNNNIVPGNYYYELVIKATVLGVSTLGYSSVELTLGTNGMELVSSSMDTNSWKPTFDIWVKNIWETTQGANESDADYSARVWEKILGDRVGNEAKLIFSTGPMSISEDYEFVIASYPVVDRTKTITSGGVTYTSEWKITVYKSEAEFDATGLFIPNANTGSKPVAGDHFFFTGIDMPHIYVEWAEERLNASKDDYLDEVSNINPSWVITLDKVRCNTLEDGEYGRTLADRLSAGCTVRTKDKRFTNNNVLTLYVQSITYTWNEPTNDQPYLVPDIEVVLSDKVVAVDGPVKQLSNDVNVIQSNYVRSADVEQVVRRVANALYLKKTGESDNSVSPTTFASRVSSANFRQGDFGGAGWGLYEDNSKKYAPSALSPTARSVAQPANASVFEVDKLVVRKEMRVNSLVVNQISYVGGKRIVSAAAIEVTQVVESSSGYTCYFDQKQGSIKNLFVAGDIAMGQVFNAENMDMRYYKMVVTSVGSNFIFLSKTNRDGSGAPQQGDTIVQYGNTTNTERQYVIITDVIGGGNQRMLSGLDSTTSDGDEYYFAGKQGVAGSGSGSGAGTGSGPRWFVGDKVNTNGEFAEWVNGQLNIKGRVSVYKSDGSYQAMDAYISGLDSQLATMQAQIDGQIQSWSGDVDPLPIEDGGVVDPTTANYPASSWETVSDRLKHMGDIYVDNTTGQGWRYTRQANEGEFYWMRITDAELAQALADIAVLQQQYAGLEYLKVALGEGTTVAGGLVLTSLIQLGRTVNNVFTVYSGINGIVDTTKPGNGIAAWYGGPMADMAEGSGSGGGAGTYAKTVFRMDGSGYLANGGIHWDASGYGGIPGITWSNESGTDVVTIGGNVKLASVSGDTVTDLVNAVRSISDWFEKVNLGTELNPVWALHIKNNLGFYGDSFGSFGGASSGSGGGGGGGLTPSGMWQLLAANTNEQINLSHLPVSLVGTTLTVGSSSIDIATAGNYLPLTGGTMLNTSLVTNLNADLLDGLHASSFPQVMGIRCDQNSIYDLRYNIGSFDRNDYPSGAYFNEYPYPYGMYISLAFRDSNSAALLFIDTTGPTTGHVSVKTRDAGTATVYNVWRELAYLDDNVASATALQTSRSIWGQPFNGTADISGAMTGVTIINSCTYFTANGAVLFNAYGVSNNSAIGSVIINKGADFFGIGPSTTSVSNISFGLVDTNGAWISEYLTITQGGNVGIGSLGPTNKLEVVGAAIIADSSWNGVKLGIGGNTIDGYTIGSYGALYLNAFSSGNVVLASAGGNVGIGTSIPSYKLDVYGDTRTSGKYYIGTNGAYFEVVNIAASGETPVYAIHSNVAFYSDSFVSAGGLSPNQGGSGIDANAMWLLLANNDSADAANELINPSHYKLSCSDSGSGNVVTGVSYNSTTGAFTVTKGNVDLSGYLPLTGGTMLNTSLVTNLNADLLDGLHASSFPQVMGIRCDQNSIYDLRYNIGSFDRNDYPSGAYFNEYPYPYGMYISLAFRDSNSAALLFIDTTGPTTGHVSVKTRDAGTATVYNVWRELAYLDDNVASATALQTSRSIWGQPFNGTADISGAMTGVTIINSCTYFTANGAVLFNAYGVSNNSAIGSVIINKGADFFGIGPSTTSVSNISFGLVDTNGAWISEYLTITQGGNVGIGSLGPTNKLEVVGAAIIADSSWNGVKLGIGGNTIDGYTIGSYGALYLNAFSSGNVILASAGGNVGIGTTSPSYKLDVNGSIHTSGSFYLNNNQAIYVTTTGSSNLYGLILDSSNNFCVGNGATNSYYRGYTLSLQYLNSTNDALTTGLYLNRSGYVGIGTTTPSCKLDVRGTIRAVNPADPATGDDVTAKFLCYSSSPYGMIFTGYANGNHAIQVQREANSAETFHLLLQVNGGYVGIGTTSPQYNLDVAGTINASTAVRSPYIYDGTNYYVGVGSSHGLLLSAYGNYPATIMTNSANRMIINGSGNVTIGASDLASTNYKLYVDGATNINGALTVSGDTTIAHSKGVYFKNSSGTARNGISMKSNILIVGSSYQVTGITGQRLDFYYDAGQLGETLGMRLSQTTGRTVIYKGLSMNGTNSDNTEAYIDFDTTNHAFHIHGSVYADGFISAGGLNPSGELDNYSGVLKIQTQVTDNTYDVQLAKVGSPSSANHVAVGIEPSATTRAYKVYIDAGGTSYNGLYVNGYAKGSSGWNASSDRRLKDNIELITKDEAIAKIMGLKPSTWNWKEDGRYGCGFVAQDVLEVIPSAVHGEDMLTLEHAQFHPWEVAMLQDHELRIRELEDENKRLKEKIYALEQ